MTEAVPDSLLGPGPTRQVRLDLTSRCNLRCVYCAVSQAAYVGIDMPPAARDAAVRQIVDLSRHHRLDPIDVNGHGETTIVPGWVEACETLLTAGLRIRITSNFAKEFSEPELAVLARMHEIAVSIDTADRKLLRDIRRRVALDRIVTNVMLVRAAARRLAHPSPGFGFLCGLYNQAASIIRTLFGSRIWHGSRSPSEHARSASGASRLTHTMPPTCRPSTASVRSTTWTTRHFARVSRPFGGPSPCWSATSCKQSFRAISSTGWRHGAD